MDSRFDTALTRVAEDTFASMAFVLPLDEHEAAAVSRPARVGARVEFTGPLDGTLALWVARDMLPTLAANMLGVCDARAVSFEQQEDALKELLNVICGNLLPQIAGTRDVFHVRAPSIVPEGSPETALCRPDARAELWLECGRADLALVVRHPSHAGVA